MKNLCRKIPHHYFRLGVNLLGISTVCLALSACDGQPWNNPHGDEPQSSILYSSFSERPKYLDPARAYSSNEYSFLGQVYEPVLQYHYLKRPYQLAPLTARTMPQQTYLDKNGREVQKSDADYVIYDIKIKPDILFQPHPAFAKNDNGEYQYHDLSIKHAQQFNKISDFSKSATRGLTGDDYIYQIKRLANPRLHSPIASILSKYIVGFSDLREQIAEKHKTSPEEWIDLRKLSLEGVRAINDYHYQIKVRSGYPQFIYWLAMPFFSPLPWEADKFYSQSALQQRNISLNWYPLGTGAYMLSENNPNLRMVLERNPNFREDYYPTEGEAGDVSAGLLDDAGVHLPLIDKAIFTLEKESIPYWNKFIQGYYDRSGISSDSFDQAVQMDNGGEFKLTEFMKNKGIKLSVAPQPSTIYIGFNMLDEITGGFSERAIQLRRALSIAINMEEYISIFLNGRGIAAHSPLPPGIFGNQSANKGFNPVAYDRVNGQIERKPLSYAKQLLASVGYKDGIDQNNGKPLILYFDAVGTGPDAKSWLNWITKQFDKLGIQLVVRNTDYNRFQEKMIEGTGQIFRWGWNADYPDPENFFFLFYGPNSKARKQGENAVNYDNTEFNQLFRKMSGLSNSRERQTIIDEMLTILRNDSPWIWGYHPKSFVVHHNWLKNVKPNLMAHNTLKYLRINSADRLEKRKQWNQPLLFPLIALSIFVAFVVFLVVRIYRKRRRYRIL